MRTYLLLLLLSSVELILADCDPSSGETCMLIEGYDSYQLARCKTNNELTTDGKFQCAESCVNACWHPCMIEFHNVEGGTVTSDCSCTPYSSPNSAIPDWCRNTTGHHEFFCKCINSTDYFYFVAEPDYFFIRDNITLITSCDMRQLTRDLPNCVQRKIIDNHISYQPVGYESLMVVDATAVFNEYNNCFLNLTTTFCNIPNAPDKAFVVNAMEVTNTLVFQPMSWNFTNALEIIRNC